MFAIRDKNTGDTGPVRYALKEQAERSKEKLNQLIPHFLGINPYDFEVADVGDEKGERWLDENGKYYTPERKEG